MLSLKARPLLAGTRVRVTKPMTVPLDSTWEEVAALTGLNEETTRQLLIACRRAVLKYELETEK